MKLEDRSYTVKEVASLKGSTEKTIYTHITKNYLKANLNLISRRYSIKAKDLEKYLEEKTND